ncbi:MAG: hypothetical protein Q7T44_07490 [Parvibaculum sp.]|nr:hypothetical protein [Parvibaculum sp.]
MRIELVGLLTQRQIIHPTEIISTSVQANTLRIRVEGYPWWMASPDLSERQSLELIFEGVTQGTLDLEDLSPDEFVGDEALEDFDVCSLAALDWAQPNIHSIFCSSPLSNPMQLYMLLHDYLEDAGSFRKPAAFLNGGARLSSFAQITSARSFKIAECPQSVCDLICHELDEQGVRYNVMSTDLPSDNRLLVRLGDSHFLCEVAYVEF